MSISFSRTRCVRRFVTSSLILPALLAGTSIRAADSDIPSSGPSGNALVGGATATSTLLPTSGPSLVPGTDDGGAPHSEFSIKTYGLYSFRTTFENAADVQTDHVGSSAEFATPISPLLRFDLNVTTEYSHYGFTNTQAILPANRFDVDGYALRIQPGLGYRVSGKLTLIAAPFVQSTAEFGAAFDKSLTYGGSVGIVNQMSPRLTTVTGISASSRLSHSPHLLPFGGISWQIDDDWKIGGEATGFGSDVRLTRRITPALSASLLGGFAQREFRLREDSPAPGGLLRENYLPIGAELAYKPSPSAMIRLNAGSSIIDDIRFDDRFGNKLARHDAHPAPFIGLAGAFKF